MCISLVLWIMVCKVSTSFYDASCGSSWLFTGKTCRSYIISHQIVIIIRVVRSSWNNLKIKNLLWNLGVSILLQMWLSEYKFQKTTWLSTVRRSLLKIFRIYYLYGERYTVQSLKQYFCTKSTFPNHFEARNSFLDDTDIHTKTFTISKAGRSSAKIETGSSKHTAVNQHEKDNLERLNFCHR